MIGLALVTFVTVFAAGLKSSVAQVVDENFAGGLVIQNSDGFSPIPQRRRRSPPARCRASRRWRRSARPKAKLVGNGAGARSLGADPRHRAGAEGRMEAGRAPGRCAASRDDQAIVSDSFASEHGLEVGDRFRLLSQTAPAAELRGRRRASTPSSDVLRQRPRHPAGAGRATSTRPRTRSTSSSPAPGADAATVQAMLTKGVEAAFPTAEVLNQQELKENREEQVGQLVNLFYALLAAGDRDLAVRDRQHAGALDPRTHPRAGDAAGDRDVAPPGADDDPLRGGDHGPDRGDPRHGPGRRSSPP